VRSFLNMFNNEVGFWIGVPPARPELRLVASIAPEADGIQKRGMTSRTRPFARSRSIGSGTSASAHAIEVTAPDAC